MAKKKRQGQAAVAKRVVELLRYDMIIAVGIALLLFAAGLGVGKYMLQRPVVQAKAPVVELNCSGLDLPELQRMEATLDRMAAKATKVECVTEMPFKYIQAPHNGIKFSQDKGKVIVQADSLISDGRGGSMVPAFFEGNTLIVAKYQGQELKPGMIISYHDGAGQKLVHRVSSVYADGIVVKGDANNADDGTIALEQVEGVVIGVLYT
jgi:hypothetical protein